MAGSEHAAQARADGPDRDRVSLHGHERQGPPVGHGGVGRLELLEERVEGPGLDDGGAVPGAFGKGREGDGRLDLDPLVPGGGEEQKTSAVNHRCE